MNPFRQFAAVAARSEYRLQGKPIWPTLFPAPGSEFVVVNKTPVNSADHAPGAAEYANAVAAAIVIRVALDGDELSAFDALDKTAVAAPPAGVDHENLTGPDQRWIMGGSVGLETRNAFDSCLIPMIEHAQSLDHRIRATELLRCLLDAEEHKGHAPGQMPGGVASGRGDVFIHLRTAVRSQRVFHDADLRDGEFQCRD